MKAMHIDARPLAAALHDALALGFAWLAATWLLRVEGVSANELADLFTIFAIAIPLQIAVNFFFGVYQGVWRYTSLPDIQRTVFAVAAGTVCVSLALHGLALDGRLGFREYLLYP